MAANLVIVKLVGVVWITVVSAIGVWAPFLCVGNSGRGFGVEPAVGTGARHTNPRPAHISSGRVFLSLANCFSAGMLLTMALVHFLPSALGAAGPAISPCQLSIWMLIGVLTPALLEHGAGAGVHGHSHGMSSGHVFSSVEKSKAKSPSTPTLLVLLMCFHGMMEGVLLGLEQHVSSLISAAMPLSIHRFFDGLVIGVSLAKEVLRATRADLSDPDSQLTAEDVPSGGSEWAKMHVESGVPTVPLRSTPAAVAAPEKKALPLCGRRVWQPMVIVWLALTPLTTAIVVLVSTFSLFMFPASVAAEKHGSVASVSAEAQARAMNAVAIAQALGSGSFVYVGLSIFLHEELRGLRADAAMLCGVGFTIMLFVLSGSEH